ncbi:hypothetical protein [Alloyangia pacifica]|uniref:hypothetical protein n=1 Tax=Alloyangia pacifica TaxID=311180 RepID=UPI001CD6D4E4|nr:hypothetical protein [Alloyangia pacifica]MCA0994896.1 hypothetical protein [Alloyangia pacifica]
MSLPAKSYGARFQAAFTAILPVRVAVLQAGGACTRPLVMADELELAPALPLGDVLVEELPIELPYGTMIVMLPEGSRSFSEQLGEAVGEALLLAQSLGGVPMEHETDALYLMAHAAARRAAALRLEGHRVDAQRFSIGLGRCLGRHWLADRRSLLPDPALFARPDFLWQRQLSVYLADLDPGFSAPDPFDVPADLLRVSDAPLRLADWAGRTETMLRAVMGAPEREDVPLQSSLATRFNLQ